MEEVSELGSARKSIRRTQVVFDLDGTLVQTREANWVAYRELGVSPPEDFHIRPWQEWCSKEIHDAKSRIIAGHLRSTARATPLLSVYDQIGSAILTNASQEVIQTLCSMFEPLRRAKILRLKPVQKVTWLRMRPPGFYFDDSLETVMKIREQTRWVAAFVQF